MKVVEVTTTDNRTRYYLADDAGAPVEPVLQYDCIIMVHSGFELIGLSRERQLAAIRNRAAEVVYNDLIYN